MAVAMYVVGFAETVVELLKVQTYKTDQTSMQIQLVQSESNTLCSGKQRADSGPSERHQDHRLYNGGSADGHHRGGNGVGGQGKARSMLGLSFRHDSRLRSFSLSL